MTMSAKIINTSNWEHEDIAVSVEGKPDLGGILKPGEMCDIPVNHLWDGSEHSGVPSIVRVRQRVEVEPKPFRMNGSQVWPRVLAFFGYSETIE